MKLIFDKSLPKKKGTQMEFNKKYFKDEFKTWHVKEAYS